MYEHLYLIWIRSRSRSRSSTRIYTFENKKKTSTFSHITFTPEDNGGRPEAEPKNGERGQARGGVTSGEGGAFDGQGTPGANETGTGRTKASAHVREIFELKRHSGICETITAPCCDFAYLTPSLFCVVSRRWG